jgi:hypothetical protein
VQTGAVTDLATDPSGASDQPVLHALPDGRALLVHRFVKSVGAPVSPPRIYTTILLWTSAWSPVNTLPLDTGAEGAWSFAAERESSDRAWLLDGTAPGSPGLSAGYATPDVTGFHPASVASSTATDAVFIRSGPSGDRLLAFNAPGAWTMTPSYELSFGRLPSTGPYDGPHEAACGDRPPAADAIEKGNGWLLATATPFGSECFDDVAPAPATTLTVTKLTSTGLFFGLSHPVSSPIGQIVALARTSGGWILYRRDPAILEAVTMNDSGQLASGPFTLTPAIEAPIGFGADGFADGFFVAYVEDSKDGPPDIVVALVRADGQELPSIRLPNLPYVEGRPAVLVDAGTRQALVVWTGASPTLGKGLYSARFGCF